MLADFEVLGRPGVLDILWVFWREALNIERDFGCLQETGCMSLKKKQSMHSGELYTGVFKNDHSSFTFFIPSSFTCYVLPFTRGGLGL